MRKKKPGRRSPNADWQAIRAAERPVERFSSHGRYTLALAYANSYHIGMSSLGFQRVYELIQRTPEWPRVGRGVKESLMPWYAIGRYSPRIAWGRLRS